MSAHMFGADTTLKVTADSWAANNASGELAFAPCERVGGHRKGTAHALRRFVRPRSWRIQLSQGNGTRRSANGAAHLGLVLGRRRVDDVGESLGRQLLKLPRLVDGHRLRPALDDPGDGVAGQRARRDGARAQPQIPYGPRRARLVDGQRRRRCVFAHAPLFSFIRLCPLLCAPRTSPTLTHTLSLLLSAFPRAAATAVIWLKDPDDDRNNPHPGWLTIGTLVLVSAMGLGTVLSMVQMFCRLHTPTFRQASRSTLRSWLTSPPTASTAWAPLPRA